MKNITYQQNAIKELTDKTIRDWNEINSKKGSLMMKEKIDNFLDFYNNIG